MWKWRWFILLLATGCGPAGGMPTADDGAMLAPRLQWVHRIENDRRWSICLYQRFRGWLALARVRRPPAILRGQRIWRRFDFACRPSLQRRAMAPRDDEPVG